MPTYSGSVVATSSSYCTLADVRSAPALNFEAAYTTDDALISSIILSVSREIDRMTGRFFYSTGSETRYFTAIDYDHVDIGDLVSITSLATDDGLRAWSSVWASTDYDLQPFNNALLVEPEPYHHLCITPQGAFTFPRYLAKGVKVVGVFGWSSVPSLIAKAALLWTERTYKRLSTPLGVSSTSQIGITSVQLPAPDNDIEMMIQTYRRIL